MTTTRKQEIQQLFKKYANGNLSARQAVESIDTTLEGINGVRYKNNKMLTVDDGNNRYSLNLNGLGKKVMKLIKKEFVPLLHYYRTQNGLGNGTEAHIDRGVSTKHYRPIFERQVAYAYARG